MREPQAETLQRVRAVLVDWAEDGVDFLPRSKTPPAAVVEPPPSTAAPTASAPDLSQLSREGGADRLAQVRAELGDCQRCGLAAGRSHLVFGEGSAAADVVFIGEGPGAEEDRTGRPFVGRAGELLNRMIEAVGWRREDVYICNLVKCRPPRNRDPQPDEIAACAPFLRAQVEAIAPRVIVTLGKPAISTLLGRSVPITRLRGRWQEWNGFPVMPTFHPAYLLRSYTRANRQAVWDDLQAARARVDADA